MRGKLSDKPFPSVVRELARENATGRLRLTQNGKIREILIESGVPVFASSTIPEEQPEHRLVQDGLITPEQLSAALVIARQTSQPVEKILVQTRAITRLGLQRILCELSTAIVNGASQWVTGHYAFAAAPKVPLEAKLIWSPTECILAGARHASSDSSVLDALAPDQRTIKPATDPEATAASSASLTSTEGYILSCIQSPTTIAEASMLTGLSHIETRRAILVLIMLGLLDAEPSANVQEQPRASRNLDEIRPVSPPENEPRSASLNLNEVRSAPRPPQPPQPVTGIDPLPDAQPQLSPLPANGSGVLPAPLPLNGGTAAPTSPGNPQSEAWPLDLDAPGYAGLEDDSHQIDFNASDISFLDSPEPSKSPRDAYQERLHQSPHGQRTGNNEGFAAPHRQVVAEQGAPAPVSTAPTDPSSDLGSGPIFIPKSGTPQAPGNGKNNSIFVPNSPSQVPQDRPSPTISLEPPAPAGDGNGSTFIPPSALPAAQPPVDSPTAAKRAAPARGNTGFIPGWAVSREQGGARTSPLTPPAPSPAAPFRPDTGSVYIPGAGTPRKQDQSTPDSAHPSQRMGEQPFTSNEPSAEPRSQPQPAPSRQPASAAPGPGYGYNGEADPRLHQEWRDQQEAAARQDNPDDERFLKRVIEELAAKTRIAATADYYQILGVDKLASNGSITKAYERITRINDSHKSRWPSNSELQSQISSLMAVVNKAYDTLGSPEKRRLYDMPPKQQGPVMEIERGTGPVTGSIAGRTTAPPVRPSPGACTSRPLPGGPPLASPVSADNRNPIEAAADLYRRGRGAFARSDLQAATHLLRQAVNLDPNQSTYHYQLGMSLFILSQARAEHKHDKGCHVTCKMGGNLTRNQRIRHEAEQHLLKASELEPSNSDIKLKLALLYKDAHMDRKAHQYFYEALMLDPNCHIARVELGMEEGRKKESAEDQWIKDLMKDRLKKK